MAENDVNTRWEEFLDPQILRQRLVSASMFLAAFEMLKDAIVERIRSFYCRGFNQNGLLIDPKYGSEVLSRDKSVLYASLSWLQENKVIDQQDLENFEGLKHCRNRVAHDMPGVVTGRVPLDLTVIFPQLVDLLHKIEVWWIVNVELPTDPDHVGEEVDESKIMPGSIMMLRVMVDVALGSEEEAASYLNVFKKQRGEC